VTGYEDPGPDDDPSRCREADAKASAKTVEPAELRWLRDLPALWEAADDSGRRLLTEAIFERSRSWESQSMTIHPTPEADAHGWSDAFGNVPLVLNAARSFSTYGRARGVKPRLTRSSGIWVPRLHRGRVFVTMGGARSPMRSVRSA